MPEEPTWGFVGQAARQLTDRDNAVYGICLRGKPRWGENTAFLTAMANPFGAGWFDADWSPRFDSPEWKEALTTSLPLMEDAGPPGASSNGFDENLAPFQSGKGAMGIDATVAGSVVTSPDDSQVADRMGFAPAPDAGLGKRADWLRAWALGVPAGTEKAAAAQTFVSWATGKGYTGLVASEEGWANGPPGTRSSLYENAAYGEAAPFADMTKRSMDAADPLKPHRRGGALHRHPVRRDPRVPGHRHRRRPAVPGRARGPDGQMDADRALASAWSPTEREMRRAGQPKE